jgi:hypothetical protein
VLELVQAWYQVPFSDAPGGCSRPSSSGVGRRGELAVFRGRRAGRVSAREAVSECVRIIQKAPPSDER